MSLRSELAQAQRHMVQNQTATMLELGTSLLNQTTAQTRKLTSVEAQVPDSERAALGGPAAGQAGSQPGLSHLDLCPWVRSGPPLDLQSPGAPP